MKMGTRMSRNLKPKSRMSSDCHNNNRDSSSFSKLPVEILVSIFSYLTFKDILRGASGVNRRFRSLCAHHVTEIDNNNSKTTEEEDNNNNNNNNNLSAGQLKKLVGLSSSRLITLTLDCSLEKVGMMTKTAVHALGHCPNLQILELQNVNKSNRKFLNFLKLQNRSVKKMALTFTGTNTFVSLLTSEGKLRIRMSYLPGVFADKLLSVIAKNCHELERLNVDEYPDKRMSKTGVDTLMKTVKLSLKELVWEGLPTNKYLFPHLGHCIVLDAIVMDNVDNMRGDHLVSIVQLPRLRLLKMDFLLKSLVRSEDYLKAFSTKKIDNLTHLSLEGEEINKEVLWAIAESCPKLAVLCLSEINDDEDNAGMRRVVERCLNLESLTMRHCEQVDESVFTKMDVANRLRSLVFVECPRMRRGFELEGVVVQVRPEERK